MINFGALNLPPIIRSVSGLESQFSETDKLIKTENGYRFKSSLQTNDKIITYEINNHQLIAHMLNTQDWTVQREVLASHAEDRCLSVKNHYPTEVEYENPAKSKFPHVRQFIGWIKIHMQEELKKCTDY